MEELAVGQKVRLVADGQTATVRYVGQTLFAAGTWVGVELGDDCGKNDGSVQGQRYFDCEMGYGMFLRPQAVQTVVAQASTSKPAPPTRTVRPARPSSTQSVGTTRSSIAPDPALGKRKSINAPSPSPIPRSSRPSSISRSPTKSPSRLVTEVPSTAANPRAAAPPNVRGLPTTSRARPSTASSRPSMGPPPVPGNRLARQGSGASTAPRPTAGTSSMSAANATRTASSRLSGVNRVAPGGQKSSLALNTGRSEAVSPRPRNDDIMSPQTASPVQARTKALEKLTGGTMSPKSTPKVALSSNTPTSASAGAASREIENLKAKIRILEKKRLEDRKKIEELEDTKKDEPSQVPQPTEKFKGNSEKIVKGLQAKGLVQQQEIKELRQQLKEAEERFESVENSQAELESAMELATLDREMAEETAEVCKAELEAIKEKAEELELEVEILREENAELTQGMPAEDRASSGWLQMERNNERLREALIRLRDLSQQQKQDLSDQIKVLEEDQQHYEKVKGQLAVSQEALVRHEVVVQDLRERLEVSELAESRIEEVQEKNLEQSEEIARLKDALQELEVTLELSEEIEINHVHNAREMQEELDFKDSVIVEQARRYAAQEQALEDMEYTMSKFRELVSSLQNDIEDMRASNAVTETESEQLNSRSRAMMDLNMKLQISAAKAQVKTIDLELRRMETEEAEKHLEIVQLFLPESYQTDRDSVLTLLRFRRLGFKASLLIGFIKERISGQRVAGHEDDVFWGSAAIDKLSWVSAMCHRFINAMSHCSLEQFAKYDGTLYELEPVERALNGWIDGLRREDLKEKQCALELQRTIALMTHLGEVHLSDDLESCADDVHMRVLLSQNHLESAAVSLAAIKTMVAKATPVADGEENDKASCFQAKIDGVISQTRSTKVTVGKMLKELDELRARSLALTSECGEAFELCEAAAAQLAEIARQTGVDLFDLIHQEGRSEAVTYGEVEECMHQTALASFKSSESELFATYLSQLRAVTSQISDLAALSSDLSQAHEFDRSPEPWVLRSREIKAMRATPIDAEEELCRVKEQYSEARRAAAQREELISEANLKIETLESRMRDAKAKAALINELEAQKDEAAREAASYREDIEKQDRELKTLETDRDKWKKIASDSRVVVGGDASEGLTSRTGQERHVATAREMESLTGEINSLQATVRYLGEDNRRARLTEQANYDWLAEPLVKPASVAQQRSAMVAGEAKDALGELIRLATSASFYRLGDLPKDKLAWKPAKCTPQYHAARQMENIASWRSWQVAVLEKSRLLLATGQQTTAPFSTTSHHEYRRKASTRRGAAARLSIRLPDTDGKTMPGLGANVHIVGSREWESLQGTPISRYT